MWDLPGLGIEPVSPLLAGRFLTTAPPGKSLFTPLKNGFPLEKVHEDLWEGKGKFYLISPQISQIFPLVKTTFPRKYGGLYGVIDYRDKTGNKAKTMKKLTSLN